MREIVDAVAPRRTFFTLEPMPWSVPDSPEAYLALLRAIDRPRFAVHLDPVNLINTPAKFFGNAAFLRECFATLGPYVKSVHAKDIVLGEELTVRLTEVRPGPRRARLPRASSRRWRAWTPTRRSSSST